MMTQPGKMQSRGEAGSGDGPLSVRGCPSTVRGHPKILSKPLRRKHLRDPPLERRSLCTPSGQKPRARPSLPGPGAGHPLHGAGGHGVPTVVRDRRRRACYVSDRPVNAGNSRSLPVTPGQPSTPAHLRNRKATRCPYRPPKWVLADEHHQDDGGQTSLSAVSIVRSWHLAFRPSCWWRQSRRSRSARPPVAVDQGQGCICRGSTRECHWRAAPPT
jgi:hypothetical protein